ncbi:MAG: glycosyltransferase [Anaerolineae bacterium]|nr:glycosyltransferase [Gloeobacterales cyanobacterium ES-bin-313]
MNRHILIVSPHFPPTNAADHQRVRLLLPYLEKEGWDPTVLAVHANAVEMVQDSYLEKTLPQDLHVHRTSAIPQSYTRRIGLGSLGLRSLPYLWRAGAQLLKKRKFDLVYFSTTVFTAMVLGPLWKKQFGIPYLVDFQDPWFNDYYERTGTRPPGGKFKYGFSQLQAKFLEPSVVQNASHIICVSPAYKTMLIQRYSTLTDEQFSILPFGANELDFQLLEQFAIKQSIFDPHDGYKHWVYVGRGGLDMAFSLRAFFAALSNLRSEYPTRWDTVRLHFIGTSYAQAGQGVKTIEPLAKEFNLEDIVQEYPDRIPYFVALKCLKDANALIVPGSNDSQYTASKIYPYILANKPLLAIFHSASSVVNVLKQVDTGKLATFNQEQDNAHSNLTQQIEGILQDGYLESNCNELNWQAFEPYTALAMAKEHCRIFESSLST